jgi:predicted DCC family thiol-disulfide oxidoreductase YuxK
LKKERVHVRSSAVLRIFGDVGIPWSLLMIFRLVPSFLRDAVYDWVARHRYRWFGRYDECPLPSPEQRARFLP